MPPPFGTLTARWPSVARIEPELSMIQICCKKGETTRNLEFKNCRFFRHFWSNKKITRTRPGNSIFISFKLSAKPREYPCSTKWLSAASLIALFLWLRRRSVPALLTTTGVLVGVTVISASTGCATTVGTSSKFRSYDVLVMVVTCSVLGVV